MATFCFPAQSSLIPSTSEKPACSAGFTCSTRAAASPQPLSALSAESGCGLAAALVEHVKPALHAGFSDVLGIKLLWAGKQNVAIGQIERTRVAEMRIMRGQIANTFGFEIKLHRITERLGEKEDCFPVVRPIGTLPEACHLGDVWRQMVGGIFTCFWVGGESAKAGEDS